MTSRCIAEKFLLTAGIIGLFGVHVCPAAAQTRGTAAPASQTSRGVPAGNSNVFGGSGFGSRGTSFAGPSAFGNSVFTGGTRSAGTGNSPLSPGSPIGGIGIGIASPGAPMTSVGSPAPGGSIVGPGSLAPGATITTPGSPPPGSRLPGNTALGGTTPGAGTSTSSTAESNPLATSFVNPAFIGLGGPVTFLPFGATTSSDAPSVVAVNGEIVPPMSPNQSGLLGTNATVPATSNVYSPYYAGPFVTGMIGSPTMLLSPAGQADGTTAGNTGNAYRSSGQIILSTGGTVTGPDSLTASPGNASFGGLRAEVQTILDRSSKIQSKGTIQVGLEGNTLVLRGLVKNDHERRLAEAIARLTPGVRDLRNELAVRTEAVSAVANR